MAGARRVNGSPGGLDDSQVSRRELKQLKWLTALVPGAVVLIYESARQEALEHILPALPVQYGNVIVWALVLLLTYAFAAFVFRIVERLQAQALARSRDLATLRGINERISLDEVAEEAGLTGVAFVLPDPANPAARAGHRVYLKRMLLSEGALLGAVTLQVLQILLIQLRVKPEYIEIAYGAAIVLAVAIDLLRQGRGLGNWFGRKAT